MKLDDLQKSELVIARILTLLMEWGIQSSQLKFEELQLEEEYAPFFFPCVNWLVHEGIIRAGGIQQTLDGPATGLVTNPVLTSYGMRSLGLQMSIDETHKTLAAAVKEVSNGERSYSQIGDFVGGILGGFTKSLGS